ncbi:MAG TPA: hypothetical protein VF758_08610 [Candidatus Acidoferrum sp.]
MYEVLHAQNWLAGGALTSNQMLILGGVLLLFAAILLGMRRRTRITLESSLVSEELMIYLARIATALEHPAGPSREDVTADVLKRLEEIANAKPNGKVRTIPQSIFAREYPEKE